MTYHDISRANLKARSIDKFFQRSLQLNETPFCKSPDVLGFAKNAYLEPAETYDPVYPFETSMSISCVCRSDLTDPAIDSWPGGSESASEFLLTAQPA